ncbi:hypothetical protein Trisim1_000671 [Trichoderma cf. simile WF8]
MTELGNEAAAYRLGGDIIRFSHDSATTQTALPSELSPDFLQQYPKLSELQAGHLRHFHNVAAQLDGQWKHMGTEDPGQEHLDAYRYQLATMAYAAGAAHYHRLPVVRSVFKELLQRLIHKMLRRDVWGYWYLTSQSGIVLDPDLKELRKPWPDPIRRENIMYSGHLLLMVSLYAMLFDDDTYEKKDSIALNWDPLCFGMGPESFYYNRATIQEVIIAEMERNKWIGVCCEPNSVFVVCNQFPLIAIRYNDVRDGTSTVDNLLGRYSAIWKRKGMYAENGLIYDFYRPNQGTKVEPVSIGYTAWYKRFLYQQRSQALTDRRAGAFMNAWNGNDVRQRFAAQALGFLSRISTERVNLNAPPVAHEIRTLVSRDGADPDDLVTIQKAREVASKANFQFSNGRFYEPTLGYVIKWVSEVGDSSTLDGLLRHADEYCNPTWEDGGLYYPRQDQISDSEGNWTFMDPFTGNAAIAYARLNISDGQKIMWEAPWTSEQVQELPFVDNVTFADGIDFFRGHWDDNLHAMILTVRTWHGEERRFRPVIRNLPVGSYGIYVSGKLQYIEEITKVKRAVELSWSVNGDEVDIVVIRTGLSTPTQS